MMQQGQGAELSISPPHGVLSLSPALEQEVRAVLPWGPPSCSGGTPGSLACTEWGAHPDGRELT
jgi:hypothetical protein